MRTGLWAATAFLATLAGSAMAAPPPNPLILLLHGATQRGLDALYESGLETGADALGARVLAPDGPDRVWRDRDLPALLALVRTEIDAGRADPNRIIVAGFSNGGVMAQTLACSGQLSVYAIVVVGMTLPENLGRDCPASASPRVLVINGTGDPIVPYAGGVLPYRGGSALLSTDETIAFWARRNGCEGGPYLDATTAGPDGSQARRISFQGCRAPVELIALVDGGHSWPNQPAYEILSLQNFRGAINRGADTLDELRRLLAEAPAGTATLALDDSK